MYAIHSNFGAAQDVPADVWASIPGVELFGGKLFQDPSREGMFAESQYLGLPTTDPNAAAATIKSLKTKLERLGAKEVVGKVGQDDQIYVPILTYKYTPTKFVGNQMYDTEAEAQEAAAAKAAELSQMGVKVTDTFVDNDIGRWGYFVEVDPVAVKLAADQAGALSPAAAFVWTPKRKRIALGVGIGLGVLGLGVTVGVLAAKRRK